MVQSMGAVTKKMKTPMGKLAETTNMEPGTMALVDRQKISIALNVEKESTLPMDVGSYANNSAYH